MRRDIPPSGNDEPADIARREAAPVPLITVTSTSWITTDDCKPTGSPVTDEECEDDAEGHDHPGDYSLSYGSSTTSGMLALPTSSQSGLYDGTPNPSENHVGE